MFNLNQNGLFPMTFAVEIAGVSQDATVLENRSDHEAFKYLVRFQDGTEAVFTEGSETEMFADRPGLDAYANALLPDLFILPAIEPEQFYYMLPYELGGKTINIWMIEHEPDGNEIENIGVHYNQRCRMEIYNDRGGVFKWRSIGEPLSEPEEAMAKDLTVTIDAVRTAIK